MSVSWLTLGRIPVEDICFCFWTTLILLLYRFTSTWFSWVFIHVLFLRPNKTHTQIKLHSVKINEKNTQKNLEWKKQHKTNIFMRKYVLVHVTQHCMKTVYFGQWQQQKHNKIIASMSIVFFSAYLRKCLITLAHNVTRFTNQIGSCVLYAVYSTVFIEWME